MYVIIFMQFCVLWPVYVEVAGVGTPVTSACIIDSQNENKWPVASPGFSNFGNVRNNNVTSRHGGSEISSGNPLCSSYFQQSSLAFL